MEPRVRNRAGVTLLEILIGLVIMGVVTASALRLVRQQDLAFSLGAGQMDALQNHRFAVEVLERNLRAAGTNTSPGQPFLVYADSAVVSINADYATRDPTDLFAVYVNPSATAQETGALTRARRIVLPQTNFAYPDSSYWNGAVNSSAETITFFFAPDTATARRDDFVLYRQVNDRVPETVARGLLRAEGEPFFRYQEVISGDTIVPRAQWVPAGSLPLRHSVPIHLSAADTGTAARIDRVRAVRVAFASVAEGGPEDRASPVRRLIRMPNAGQRTLRTCGEEPVFTSSVTADLVGESVEVRWDAAFDEVSGEGDVVRYAIFRQKAPDTDWGEPRFSVPAGQASYLYTDAVDLESGSTYRYAIAAQDCTPTMSVLRLSPPVLIP